MAGVLYSPVVRLKAFRPVEQEPIKTQFKWRIPDFFSVIEDENIKWYKSERFEFESVSFYFRLYPRSRPVPGFVKFCLICPYSALSYHDRFSEIEYSYGFETRDNNVTKVVRGIMSEDSKCHGRCVIRLSEILERKSELASSGVVTIVCKMKRYPLSSQPKISEEPKQMKLEKLETLSSNFKSLFMNKESCDVTLQVMDKEFKAHRTVLMARSPVFAAMLQHQSSPKQTHIVTRRQKRKSQKMVTAPSCTITVPDCDPGSFELFYKFLYSGDIEDLKFSSSGDMEELSTQTALHLYEMSNKYKVTDLETLCKEFLTKNLTVENVFDVGIIADKYQDAALFYATQIFFCCYMKIILYTPMWDSFVENNPLLSKKYFARKLSKRKRPRLA